MVCLSDAQQRARWLEEVDGTLRRLFPRVAPGQATAADADGRTDADLARAVARDAQAPDL